MNDHPNNNWLAERAHQAMLDNGFAPEFSDAVFDQLRSIAAGGEPEIAAEVQDLRHLLWSSIDNRTSRDLDQVEWAERLGPLLPPERLTVTLSIEGDGRRATLEGEARFGEV